MMYVLDVLFINLGYTITYILHSCLFIVLMRLFAIKYFLSFLYVYFNSFLNTILFVHRLRNLENHC